jgi:AcrR family transcriptional regulator
MLDRGDVPNMVHVAAEAGVSRTTLYRYFPTQDSLLLELSVAVSVDSIDGLLSEPLDGATPQDRLLELVDAFNRYVADNETLTRTALRHYLDTWLAAERAGEEHVRELREGRRRSWISTALAPILDALPSADRQRLVSALCLVMGGEAVTVLRDVCQLEPDEAIAVAHWAAEAILAAAQPRTT